MYCKNCGIENEEYAAYCLNCGSKLEAIPPQNNYTAAAPAKVTPPDQISNFNTQQSPSDNLNRPNNNVPVFQSLKVNQLVSTQIMEHSIRNLFMINIQVMNKSNR